MTVVIYMVFVLLWSSARFVMTQYECTEDGHRVLSNPLRSELNTPTRLSRLLCDKSLDRGWYRLEVFGKYAEIPTKCVQVNHCGTSAPIWLNTNGANLPSPNASDRFSACVSWALSSETDSHSCCFFSFPITVTNCGDFFVYYLQPARGCNMAYCASEAREKCGAGQISPDGFEPCRESFPAILELPVVQPVIFLDTVQLQCAFTVTESDSTLPKVYSVTWFKAERNSDMYRELRSDDISGNSANIDLLSNFRMGEKVLCTVQAFFNNTRELISPPIESDVFQIEIKVSPSFLNISEDGVSHLITFESSVPLRCYPYSQSCRIKIPLSVVNNDTSLDSDITLSDCSVVLNLHSCGRTESPCPQALVYTKAILDFHFDGRRTSEIITGIIRSPEEFWDGYNPINVLVTTEDVAAGYCFSFPDPHIITFDRGKYDFYKTGTFVMYKSNIREFEVQSRFWQCSNTNYFVSCNCGFVAREDNDIISVDMCKGEIYNSEVEIQVKSEPPLSGGVRILEARNRSKITIEFPSGAFVRADIADWGMSITVRAPPIDFEHTAGLCGSFDGNAENDLYHENEVLVAEEENAVANEFAERWRLPDGGMFTFLPMFTPFNFRLPSCTCSARLRTLGEGSLPESACSGGSCTAPCSSYMDMNSYSLITGVEITSLYSNVISNPGPLSIRGPPPVGFDFAPSFAFPFDDQIGLDFREAPIIPEAENQQRNYLDLDVVAKFLETVNQGFPAESRSSNMQGIYYIFPEDETSQLKPLTPAWPTQSGITEEQARELCISTIRDSYLGFVCGIAGLGTDEYVSDTVELCVSDIQVTDDPLWRYETIPLLENLCEVAVLEGTWSPFSKEDFQNALNCPNMCSGHGECSKMGCKCEEGYVLPDCSLQEGIAALLKIEKNGLCDIREELCDFVDIVAKNINRGTTVECVYSNLRVSDKVHGRPIFSRSTGNIVNQRTVRCPLDLLINEAARPEGLLRVDIQVLVDGRLSQNNLTLNIFDSKCYTCNWKGDCSLKSDSCLIDGICYKELELSPSDPCSQCQPRTSLSSWSANQANLPPVIWDPMHIVTFIDQPVQYQVLASDPEGSNVTFDMPTQMDSGLSALHLTINGDLSVVPSRKGTTAVPIIATDQCGALTLFEILIDVISCDCQNGGSCNLLPASNSTLPPYTCTCTDLFTGSFCEQSILGCDSLHCMYGDCSMETGAPVCLCNDGFTGLFCSLTIDPCEHNPCYPGVECFSRSASSFVCRECPDNMVGDGYNCVPSPCGSCPRNAICDKRRGCICEQGRFGTACSDAVCAPKCENNGICVSPNVCQCPVGFSGQRCEMVRCLPPCMNNGTCTPRNQCTCKQGYFGNRCEASSCGVQCQNGGFCAGPGRCQCRPGFTGATCSTPVCQHSCRNGGVCSQPGSCQCPRGFRGSFCEIAVCSFTCQNGGSCTRQNRCLCPRGYMGKKCETTICEPRCMNGGRCIKPNKCSCPSGYKGKKCQKAICVSGCKNGGECVQPNSCLCKSGYTGPNCQTAICSQPCMYGGYCVKPDRCQCRQGRRGHFCEKSARRSSRSANEKEDFIT